MNKYTLQGKYTICEWQKIDAIIKNLPAGCKIDFSQAELDEGCKIIVNQFNKQGEFSEIPKYDYNQTFFNFLWRSLVDFFHNTVSIVSFFSVLRLRPKYKFQREIIMRDLLNSCYSMGVQAIFIVMFFSFCMGVIISLECAAKLTEFGAESCTVDLIVLSFFKEMALFTGLIVICARSSSAIIAKIGVMRISDEWNAIKITGINPITFLLWPKIIAFTVLTPFLSYVASFSGLFGGYCALKSLLRLNIPLYIEMIACSLTTKVFFTILIKGPILGLISGLITAYSAKQISLHTENMVFHITRGVVYSIFGAIFIDMLFNIFFFRSSML